MPKLTVQNAEIHTATVEVRTLTLSGKQVTLSVFKQIEQAPIIQKDGTLAGEPWGRVNYHPEKCADRGPHHHVVWQYGTDLRRATHFEPDFGTFRSKTANDFTTAALFLALSGNRNVFPGGKIPALGWHRGFPQVAGGLKIDDNSFEYTVSDLAAEAYARFEQVKNEDNPSGRKPSRQWTPTGSHGTSDDAWPEPATSVDGPSAYDRAAERFNSALADLDAEVSEFGSTATELLDNLQQELRAEAARRARCRASWQAICSLPQLFIAV